MKKFWLTLLLIFLSFFPLLDLLHPGLPVTHDGKDHVARIANFYESLSEGKIVPRWAENLNWGYGHPILMFLYPLPSYLASFFHAFRFTFIDSTKLVFGITYILSVVAMFLWLRKPWGNAAGFVAALLYGFAPYRFVDLYVRGALGEHVAFIFMPLICWGIYGIANSEQRRWKLLFFISILGLLLAHNAVSLMFIPIFILYVIYIWYFDAKRDFYFIYKIILFTLLGFLSAAFFWVPAFFEGKYTLRDIVTGSEVLGRFVPFQNFINSPWNYGGGNEFTKQIGLVSWVAVITSLLLLFRRKEKNIQILIVGSSLLFLFSLVLMTSTSFVVWKWLTILQKFQFPWRFLTISVFISACTSVILLSSLSKIYRRIVCVITFIVIFLTTYNMWHANQYVLYNDSYFSNVYAGTTDTGESSPIWSIRFMEQNPPNKIGIIEGVGEIENISRSSTRHVYQVKSLDKVRLVEQTLYFPGWTVLIDDKPQNIEFQDQQYRGLITFWAPEGVHTVDIVFQNTKLRYFAEYVSLGSIALFCITLYLQKRKI